jgi:hypothetical protein
MSAAATIHDNPFATRYVRPGRIDYRFQAGQDAERLIERLRSQHWWGEIVGPHGSGKSTLVETLCEQLERVGRHAVMIRLHAVTPLRILGVGFRCTWPFAPRTSAFSRSEKPRICEPCSVKMLNSVIHAGAGRPSGITSTGRPWSAATQIVADGYEQLGRLGRARLRWAVRRAGGGLLVTAHTPIGLPSLLHTAPDLGTVQAIARTLLGDEAAKISDRDVAASFADHQGNVREVLFDLYDLYERRRGG